MSTGTWEAAFLLSIEPHNGSNLFLLTYLDTTLILHFIVTGYNLNNSELAKMGTTNHNLLPAFDDILTRQIYARVGQTLLLPCTVKHLGTKVVSWIRSKDLHILTSGRHTFSSDSRFESVHSDSSGDFWGLRIRGVHVSDTGQYECQVNTEPKMSLAISLRVTGT
ncbi:hypothetical protein NQ317_012835 [Molorchus minor]|uniref:Ig-like domain-containing protein n=1 Tax=Molorchus minor TaxID=1323400 RepID=A0ABQ9JA58_9CUCU|nr:hypothetical protein NQ317_012835 [Molorchus minor]